MLAKKTDTQKKINRERRRFLKNTTFSLVILGLSPLIPIRYFNEKKLLQKNKWLLYESDL